MNAQRTPTGAALTALILEVFRLNGRLLAAGDRITRPAGLTSARWQVLGAIDAAPQTVSQIARAMGLARQSVQWTADTLEREGIVRFADNAAHRRSKLVALTERGRSVLNGVTEKQIRWSNALGARLRINEVQLALRVIRDFRLALEQSGGREVKKHSRHDSRKVRRGGGSR
jgi:DNA-binding MarR family transcriptional regulator